MRLSSKAAAWGVGLALVPAAALGLGQISVAPGPIAVATPSPSSSAPAHDVSPPRDPGAEEPMPPSAEQSAADDFDVYRETHPVAGYSSYAVRPGTLILYLASPPDAEVSAEIAGLRARHRISIDVRSTPFEHKELIAGMNRLLPRLVQIPEYVSIGPSKNQTSVRVGYEGDLTPQLTAQFRRLVGTEFPGVPVTFGVTQKAGVENLLIKRSERPPDGLSVRRTPW